MVVVGASPGGVDALGRAAARHYFFKARVVLEHDRPIRAMALGREQLGSAAGGSQPGDRTAEGHALVRWGIIPLDTDYAKLSRELWHMDLADEVALKGLIERHARYTGSARAKEILEGWAEYRTRFVKVFPKEYRRALAELAAKHKRIAA